MAWAAGWGAAAGVLAADAGRIVLDPFGVATQGLPACPTVQAPSYSLDESRLVAHQRIERGTSCALAGTCEPGGAYKRDPQINQRVIDALRADPALADTSLWVSTSRKFVTVAGCLRSTAQKRRIEALVKALPGVELVWVEAVVHAPR